MKLVVIEKSEISTTTVHGRERREVWTGVPTKEEQVIAGEEALKITKNIPSKGVKGQVRLPSRERRSE